MVIVFGELGLRYESHVPQRGPAGATGPRDVGFARCLSHVMVLLPAFPDLPPAAPRRPPPRSPPPPLCPSMRRWRRCGGRAWMARPSQVWHVCVCVCVCLFVCVCACACACV